MEKVYSYRFYPTPEQESLLRKTFGCVRLVYNRAVAARTDAWDEPQERVGYVQPSAMLTEWKKQDDFQFLNEVSSAPLQQRFRHLQTAFTNCFAGRAGYPQFNEKRNGGSLAVGHTLSACGGFALAARSANVIRVAAVAMKQEPTS
ncbi:helix-turn-helix domain-containing protein [Synechococcus sp. PCC 6716]|nr:helix-turn-helix domain-containing protein [Synechococcus sp. PCC 6716]